MKQATSWGAVLASLAIVGCSAGEHGSSSADLAFVDERTIEGRADLFIDPAISWRPMAGEQLASLGGSAEGAIPVTVEVYEGVAVAWIRNEAATRTRADIVGLFRVVEHATPTRDEVRRGGEGESVLYVPMISLEGALGDETPTGLRLDPSGDIALVDWIDRSRFPPEEDLSLWRELGASHPGCLE